MSPPEAIWQPELTAAPPVAGDCVRRGWVPSGRERCPRRTAACRRLSWRCRLRASPEPGCRSCSVRRNVSRTPSLRSVGRLCPIRARTRSLRACFRWSGPHTATDSGAVSAGSNPAGGTAQNRPQEADGRVQALRRDGGPCGTRLAIQVRQAEVEAGRNHSRFLLRLQEQY
jgi:hypothetical protein